MDKRVSDFIASGPLKNALKDISYIFKEYDPSENHIDGAASMLRDCLEMCKVILNSYIDKIVDADKHVLKRMLIFALRDNLQQITTHDNIERTELFDTGEKDFKELFGYELHLKTRAELPTVHPGAYNYGPSRDDGMDPLNPPGPVAQNSSLHHQYTILNNLHERLIALEQRMGVN